MRRSAHRKSYVEAPKRGSLVGFAGKRPSSSTFGRPSQWVRSSSSMTELPEGELPNIECIVLIAPKYLVVCPSHNNPLVALHRAPL